MTPAFQLVKPSLGQVLCVHGKGAERLCRVAPLDLRIQKEENLVTFFYRCAFIFISLSFISMYCKVCILKFVPCTNNIKCLFSIKKKKRLH